MYTQMTCNLLDRHRPQQSRPHRPFVELRCSDTSVVQFETPSVESRENGTNMVWVPCQPTEDSDSRSITVDWWERHSQGGLSSWPWSNTGQWADVTPSCQQSRESVLLPNPSSQLLKQVCKLLGPGVATTLVSAFVLSRLDYCNAILTGLPKTTIAPL